MERPAFENLPADKLPQRLVNRMWSFLQKWEYCNKRYIGNANFLHSQQATQGDADSMSANIGARESWYGVKEISRFVKIYQASMY